MHRLCRKEVILNLDFKQWLMEIATFAPAGYSRADQGIRDIRYGYEFQKKSTPPLPLQAASGFIDGMGNLFRKSMGTAFPMQGTGYHASYFEPAIEFFKDGSNNMVISLSKVMDDPDDKQAIEHMTQQALHLIHTSEGPELDSFPNAESIRQFRQFAEKEGIDLSTPLYVDKEITEKGVKLRLTFGKPKNRFKQLDSLKK